MTDKCWKWPEKQNHTGTFSCFISEHVDSGSFLMHFFIILRHPANSGRTPLCIGKPFHLILWIKEFVYNQLWHVKWNGCLSNEPVLNTSVPQGRAISSFILSIYADEIMCNNNCLVQIRHADNAAQEASLIPRQRQQKKTMLQSWQIGFDSRHLRQNKKSNEFFTPWPRRAAGLINVQLLTERAPHSRPVEKNRPLFSGYSRWTLFTPTYSNIPAAAAQGTRCQ